MRRFFGATLALVGAMLLGGGRAMESATPEQVGMSSQRLQQIVTDLQKLVDEGKIPGASFMVTRSGKYVFHGEVGYSDTQTSSPFYTNSICRLLSSSKPISAAGILKMVEMGLLRLDQRLDSILPEWKDMRVYVTNTQDGIVTTVPANRPITIHDLLTHTSGLSYGYGFGNMTFVDSLYPSNWQVPDMSMQEFSDAIAKVPLLQQPGFKWRYSYGFDVLGVVMWKVTGETPDVWLQKNLFEPLKLYDTGFYVPSDKISRYTTTYQVMNVYGYDRLQFVFRPRADFASYSPPEFKSLGGGILSTAKDLARFGQFLLNGGTLDGTRVLGARYVDLMWRNYLSQDQMPMELNSWVSDANTGQGYGATIAIGRPLASISNWDAYSGDNRIGGIGWGGGAQTNFQVNADTDTVVVFMIQKMGGADYFQPVVIKGVYDAITGGSPRKMAGGISTYTGVPSDADGEDGFGNNLKSRSRWYA